MIIWSVGTPAQRLLWWLQALVKSTALGGVSLRVVLLPPAGLKLVDNKNAAGVITNDPAGKPFPRNLGFIAKMEDEIPIRNVLVTAISATCLDLADVPLLHPCPSVGFTIVDVFAMGAAGHGLGVGIVLGLKGIGAL